MSEQIFHIGIKALVQNAVGRVLLMKETFSDASYWDIPGGRMDAGEQFTDTLRRELTEEIGVSDYALAEHFMTTLSNKQIPTPNGPVALMLVVFRVTLPIDADPHAMEDSVVLDWMQPPEAAEALADKYPPDFCEQIRGLGAKR